MTEQVAKLKSLIHRLAKLGDSADALEVVRESLEILADIEEHLEMELDEQDYPQTSLDPERRKEFGKNFSVYMEKMKYGLKPRISTPQQPPAASVLTNDQQTIQPEPEPKISEEEKSRIARGFAAYMRKANRFD